MDTDEPDPHALLSDGTRLAIFRELVQCFIESPLDRGVSFTTLFNRTDVEDSGLFNYHLNHLVGTLATELPAGYTLTYAGVQVAGNIFSIRSFSFPDALNRELSRPCPLCANSLELWYKRGLLRAGCESCCTFEGMAPPRLVQSHPPDRVADIHAINLVADLRRAQRGVCEQCAGHVEWEMHETDGDRALDRPDGSSEPTSFAAPVIILGVCQTCAAVHVSGPGGFAVASAQVMTSLSETLPKFWEDPTGWFIRTNDTTLQSYDLKDQTASVVVHVDDLHIRVQMDHRGVPSEVSFLDHPPTDSKLSSTATED
jgi:hypothetical protein